MVNGYEGVVGCFYNLYSGGRGCVASGLEILTTIKTGPVTMDEL
jgi:hypothetical protein